MKKIKRALFAAALLLTPILSSADRGITVATTSVQSAGDITGVTAGTGLSGGGTVGTVTLELRPDATSYIQNTGSNQNATLNIGSATVRGTLTVGTIASTGTTSISTITASTITTGGLAVTSTFTMVGKLDNSNLESVVSLLGQSISLTSEITGTLPIANLTNQATNYWQVPTTGTFSASHGITGTTVTLVHSSNNAPRAETTGSGSKAAWVVKNPATSHEIGIETQTDAGGGAYPGAASSLNIYAGGSFPITMSINDAIVWNSSTAGEITKPLQPSFLVKGAGSSESNVTGDGTVVTVTYGSEIFDQGGDIANSTFTAPVSGRYQLCASALFADIAATHTQKYIQIVTSNRTYRNLINDLLARVTFNMNICALADMDAGDTAYVQIAADDSTKTVDLNRDSNTNNFSGYLAN